MKITHNRLEKVNACEEQLVIFNRLFPKGCQPTIENLTELASHSFINGRGKIERLDPWYLEVFLLNEDQEFYMQDIIKSDMCFAEWDLQYCLACLSMALLDLPESRWL